MEIGKIESKDIIDLHNSLIKYLKEENFSEAYLERVSHNHQKLILHMNLMLITKYHENIGREYLISLTNQDNNKAKKKVSFNYDARYISLLNSILTGKWVIKKTTKDQHIPFPGKIGNYIEIFLLEYSTDRQLSKLTRDNYYRALFKFCINMEQENISCLSEITSEKVLSFISSIQSSQDHVAIILRALLNKMYEDKIIGFRTANILAGFKLHGSVKLPTHYSPEEIIRLESAVDRKYSMGKRDYAMILLATRLGLRSSDIRHLQFSNIDWDKNYIYLEQYKTKKTIELPLLTDIGEAIIDYIKHGRPKITSKYIFLRGKPPYVPLTNGGLARNITHHFNRAEIDFNKRKHGCHALRHSLATNMLKKGTSINIISESLGHTNTSSTMTYIHLDTEGLRLCSLDVPIVNETFYQKHHSLA